MFRMPVNFVGEYRGMKQAGEFVPRGESKAVPTQPVLKFEYVDAHGEPTMVEVKAGQLDKGTTLDWAKLDKGQLVHVEGLVSAFVAKENADSYVMLSRAEIVPAGSVLGVVDAKGAPLRVAA